MGKTFFIALVLTLVVYSCKRTDSTPSTDVLSSDDSLASVNMSNELRMMHDADDSVSHTPHVNLQHYWDSIYHEHDSLFWHQHNLYHHETYAHDDHHHEWVPLDTTVDHSHHYHHPYPHHPHDSLITTANGHEHDNSNHHHPGHDLEQHHDLDSLHHTHILHHP